jgi:hypothetical protein
MNKIVLLFTSEFMILSVQDFLIFTLYFMPWFMLISKSIQDDIWNPFLEFLSSLLMFFIKISLNSQTLK